MRIVRRADERDLNALVTFANTMTLGVTSLPKHAELMKEKLLGGTSYFFILEDLETGDKIGTCQLAPRTGYPKPIWLFKIEGEFLIPAEIKEGPSELKGLFLNPEFRHDRLGKLLSWSRFLYLASFPELFQDKVIAQMRGVITEDNSSPFWDSYGKKITGESLVEVLDHYSIDGTPPETLKRKVPLSEVYRESLGFTHKNTTAALNLLFENGFHLLPYIDPIDAGPTVEADVKDIKAVQQCKTYTLVGIEEFKEVEESLMCSKGSSWRATSAPFRVNEKGAYLNKETVDALNIALGDTVLIMVPQKSL